MTSERQRARQSFPIEYLWCLLFGILFGIVWGFLVGVTVAEILR